MIEYICLVVMSVDVCMSEERMYADILQPIPKTKKMTDNFRIALKPHLLLSSEPTDTPFHDTVLYWPPHMLMSPFYL